MVKGVKNWDQWKLPLASQIKLSTNSVLGIVLST